MVGGRSTGTGAGQNLPCVAGGYGLERPGSGRSANYGAICGDAGLACPTRADRQRSTYNYVTWDLHIPQGFYLAAGVPEPLVSLGNGVAPQLSPGNPE
ncbi:MAG: hypothetical protein AAGU11_08685 [Syntrophobacteraceae bacterium]